ncbi:hypothetical protein FIBSPDRAFT_660821, partial [Athelia psychrophila]
SVRGLAKSFGVTLSTLQNRLNGAQSRSDEMESRRRLSPVETKVLASHAERMQALKFPLTPADVRLEGERLFHAKDPEAAAQGAKLGINWYREVFLKDNPDFVNKLGKGLDRDRATCASHAQLSAWFENVKYITEYGITWENFWNMDEKGYLIGEFSEHFLLPLSLTSTGIGTAQIFYGKHELITVIEAISAAGACHHPTILLKGKTFQSRWLKYKIQGASYGNTERGWTTDAEAITWLEGFLKATKPSDPNAWRLLLIDGHGSHKT